MSSEPALVRMWVVRDHGVEGKARPGRVVAICTTEDEARAIDNWGYSHRESLMLLDPVSATARFVSDPVPVHGMEAGGNWE